MGSFLSKLFGGKSSHEMNSPDRHSHKQNHRNSHHHQHHPGNEAITGVANDSNNQVLFKKSVRKQSAHDVPGGELPPYASRDDHQQQQQQHSVQQQQRHSQADPDVMSLEPSEEIDLPTESPFKRDYYTSPGHDVLVSVEKNRPRRSNIRRSSRLNPLSSRPSTAIEIEKKPTLMTITSQISTNSNEELEVSQMTFESLKDESEVTDVDELPEKEKRKVVKDRLTMLFDKKPMPVNNLPKSAATTRNMAKPFESQDTFTSGSFESFDNFDFENHVKREQLYSPVTFVEPFEKTTVNTSSVPTTATSSTTNETMSPPPRVRGFGNAMLIDELKKRQSTFLTNSEV